MPRDTSDWRAFALCAQTDPELWFPEMGESRVLIAAAKRICNQCPVKDECLEEGIETYPASGIWGGYTIRGLRTVRLKLGKEADRDDLTA